uniref:hypothetical protein n=1 Tax=Paractinoplanes polyasparticus TaxID=2856853 RepID=UPI001C85A7DC|nr:hypothetical protein [Actinoplanes polyasparticus]
MVSVEAVVADTDEQAAALARPTDMARAMPPGSAGLLSPGEAAAVPPPEAGRDYAEATGAAQARGSVGTVRRRFAEIVEQTGADELMLCPNILDPEARIRSYELAARAAEN